MRRLPHAVYSLDNILASKIQEKKTRQAINLRSLELVSINDTS